MENDDEDRPWALRTSVGSCSAGTRVNIVHEYDDGKLLVRLTNSMHEAIVDPEDLVWLRARIGTTPAINCRERRRRIKAAMAGMR